MRRSQVSTRALALTYRPALSRLLVACLLCISLGFLVYSKSHEGTVHATHMAVAAAVMPVVSIVAKPGDAIAGAADWLHDMATLKSQNENLKRDNARLMQWQSAATELQSENTRLRDLLRFAPPGKPSFASARIVADTASPYSRSAIITSGSDQGVAEDLAVINESGLVGRIVEAGKKTSRVLLLTDMNSRVPVVSETSRERAIAGGTGADSLSLFYLPENSKIAVGEKIVTSGDGGVLPPGLPVGVVSRIEKGVPVVTPFVDWYHLEYVSIVDYSM